MKPTTQARIDRVAALLADQVTPGRVAALREIMEFLLREQDRDTRNACAEAILDLPHDMTHTDAHRAVMNAQAV